MVSISSKVIFGIGVALAVAAVASILVTMVADQKQNSNSQSSPSSGNERQRTGTSSSGGQQPQVGASSTITIPQGAASQQTRQFYQPDPAQVSAEVQVTWQNKDSAPHTATADDGSFDTGNIQPGQPGSAKVQGQGQVSYHCTIHPFMKGKLQVSAGGSSPQQGNSPQQSSNNNTSQSNSSQQTP